ncbi:hypothetical protein PHAVU_007G044400 [Phaseolus vulgaris]|uniref:Uncharacterized protein n=1 Tax=Phaseolus vulgaris TaxID=3885 RepID=V7BDV6_PHAVU|nr:hypothetical protein PHAVU_007G044400g [Phaseolus vulgaris]ESW15103.1 hypothetical protein PHAVU_007G044400g [Phaseolus vulgaris]
MQQVDLTSTNRRKTLNLFLRNIQAVDSIAADKYIRTSAANIRNFELRLEVLQKEQLELI